MYSRTQFFLLCYYKANVFKRHFQSIKLELKKLLQVFCYFIHIFYHFIGISYRYYVQFNKSNIMEAIIIEECFESETAYYFVCYIILQKKMYISLLNSKR